MARQNLTFYQLTEVPSGSKRSVFVEIHATDDETLAQIVAAIRGFVGQMDVGTWEETRV